MCKFIAIIVTISVLFGLSHCATSFDQRQTGDLNVQIGLKNIQLIALLKGGKEEYVDYDYAYDYSEMTIKPQNGTTPKPLNVTNTQIQQETNSSTATIAGISNVPSLVDTGSMLNGTELKINGTVSNSNTMGPSVNATEVLLNQIANMVSVNYTADTSTINIVADAPTPSTVSPPDSSDAPNVSITKCRRGFVQNKQGKCEFKVHGTSNALRRIVKLAQKIKIGRGYTET